MHTCLWFHWEENAMIQFSIISIKSFSQLCVLARYGNLDPKAWVGRFMLPSGDRTEKQEQSIIILSELLKIKSTLQDTHLDTIIQNMLHWGEWLINTGEIWE